MNVQALWAVIGAYNQHTKAVQATLFVFLIFHS